MPVFSLPSRYGIGTFGKEAYRFVDFLKKGGQSFWQILPLCPTNYGDSPYQSFSAFAGNPYFIDIDMLIDEGLLFQNEAESFDFGSEPNRIDYGLLYKNRLSLLKIAFSRFKADEKYLKFCENNAFWLDSYSLFMVLKDKNGGAAWQEWEAVARERDKKYLENISNECKEELEFYNFIQYKFACQWEHLKTYANQNGIKIIGDIPIYAALDSADFWANRKQFLTENGKVKLVAGCPPDAFSEDGQKWGNPLYDWKYMKEDDYGWWKRRIAHALSLYDVVRIDHFRGFEAFYAIPAGDENAKRGAWKKGPGIKLFKSLFKEFSKDMPIIAEDLGFLTESVRKLLKDTAFPGMKVLQFAFDTREESDYLPHNYNKNCVVYTGTHDNDTILGWEQTAPSEDIAFAKRYMNADREEGFNWSLMRLALSSVADTAILMMPDLLSAGSEARINTPSTLGGNWVWRISGDCINDWLAGILYEYTALYGRIEKDA